MRRRVLAALAALAIAAAAPAAARALGADRETAVRAAVEPIRVRTAVPALAVAVIDHGEIVFEGGFGQLDARPVTAHDRFRVASISKLLAGQAVMQLVDRKALALDDDVGRWLPDLKGRGLTVRRLLTHHSGLRDTIFPQESEDPARVAAYLALLARQPARPAAGAPYAYTDADFNVLGALVAAVSGEPYAAYVQRHVIAPLGLRATAAFPSADTRAGVAPPTLSRPGGARPYDIAFAASEGLVTSAHDLALWTRATLRRDTRLLSRASHRAMMVGQSDGGAPGRHAGLAWQLRYNGERLVAEHAGSVRGYSALVLTYPDERRAVVILTNGDDAPRWEIARALELALHLPTGE